MKQVAGRYNAEERGTKYEEDRRKVDTRNIKREMNQWFGGREVYIQRNGDGSTYMYM